MNTHRKREDSGEREKAASHTQPSSAGHGARPLGSHAGITQVQDGQQRNHEGPVPGATPSAVLEPGGRTAVAVLPADSQL